MKNVIIILILSLTSFIQTPCLADTQQIVVKSADDLDTIWSLYQSSKDKAYIKQILEVLNQDDETLFLAYEYLNRLSIAEFRSQLEKKRVEPNVEDIRNAIIGKEKQQPGYSNKIFLVTTAMWSLQGNLKTEQDKTNYKEVIQEHPELDYSLKIKKILGK